jgi:hypothetical protein
MAARAVKRPAPEAKGSPFEAALHREIRGIPEPLHEFDGELDAPSADDDFDTAAFQLLSSLPDA